MTGHNLNIYGQIGRVRDGSPEVEGESIVSGGGRTTVHSGLGRGGRSKSKSKSPASSCFTVDALDGPEDGLGSVIVKPNRSSVLVSTSSSVVGVGEGDRDGGVMPSKHWSKVLRLGRSDGWDLQQSSSISHKSSVNHAARHPCGLSGRSPPMILRTMAWPLHWEKGACPLRTS